MDKKSILLLIVLFLLVGALCYFVFFNSNDSGQDIQKSGDRIDSVEKRPDVVQESDESVLPEGKDLKIKCREDPSLEGCAELIAEMEARR